MPRINVFNYEDGKELAGWFDPEKSLSFEQGTRWNGHNHVGVITGSDFIDEILYRTPRGRWVLNHDATRYNHGPDTYEFLTDEQAKKWLLRSEVNDGAIKEYFGELEDESGPENG